MEHAGEVWQELDLNGEFLGGVDPADFDYSEERLLYGAVVMLYRYGNGEVEYLFQHRSKLLKVNPDKWDVSAGGHVNLGEKRIDAVVRETKEEIGVEIDKDKLEFAATYLRWRVVCGLYFYDWTGREDEFCFDDQEVEEVKWVKHSELEEFWPMLKNVLTDDIVFRYYLDKWNKKVIERNK